jgi:catechol 2,3-dioxygenase-like lactoylglutathione lyase family enzyme
LLEIWELGFGASNIEMKIKEIDFVAIPVTDIPSARTFYEGVLGLQVSDEMMGGKWVEYAVGDETLAIANVGEQWTPSDQGDQPVERSTRAFCRRTF